MGRSARLPVLGCSAGAGWPGSGVMIGGLMVMPVAAHVGGKATVTLAIDWPPAKMSPASGAKKTDLERLRVSLERVETLARVEADHLLAGGDGYVGDEVFLDCLAYLAQDRLLLGGDLPDRLQVVDELLGVSVALLELVGLVGRDDADAGARLLGREGQDEAKLLLHRVFDQHDPVHVGDVVGVGGKAAPGSDRLDVDPEHLPTDGEVENGRESHLRVLLSRLRPEAGVHSAVATRPTLNDSVLYDIRT